jgi:riboflavin biosynthesis pyrimidine reductase
MFTDSDQPPIVLTSEQADPRRRRRLGSRAEVHAVGETRVSMTKALDLLGRLAIDCVLCEGGPNVNAQLLAEDLVEEWCQTTSPTLVGGESSRSAVGPAASVTGDPQGSGLPQLHLDRLLEADGMLLARYLRQR